MITNIGPPIPTHIEYLPAFIFPLSIIFLRPLVSTIQQCCDEFVHLWHIGRSNSFLKDVVQLKCFISFNKRRQPCTYMAEVHEWNKQYFWKSTESHWINQSTLCVDCGNSVSERSDGWVIEIQRLSESFALVKIAVKKKIFLFISKWVCFLQDPNLSD